MSDVGFKIVMTCFVLAFGYCILGMAGASYQMTKISNELARVSR